MANNLRSDLVTNGRYSVGGTTDINGNNLGWWDRKIFDTSPLDVELEITKKYSRRPDRLAQDMYGKSSFRWFILEYNNISNVTTEFIEGKTIMLPTRDRLLGEMLSSSSVKSQ